MRRFLLLGVALAASGAIMVSSILASNAGSVSVTAGNTGVRTVQGDVIAGLNNVVGTIAANGLFQRVADIQVYQPDAGLPGAYQLRTTGHSLTNIGTSTGNCGAGYTYSPYFIPTVVISPLTNAWQTTGQLGLSISPSADTTCVVSGAVVTINYESY